MMDLQNELSICIRHQAECAAYRGPDMAGAWDGLCDWIMEECLLLAEHGAITGGAQKRLRGVR